MSSAHSCSCPSSVAASFLAPAINSLVPTILVNIGTLAILLLSLGVRSIAAVRPKAAVAHLNKALTKVAHKLYAIETSQQTEEIANIRATLTSIQLQAIDLHRDALCAGGPGQEIALVIRGYWWSVMRCLREVDILDSKVE
ncbi:hypothetical protein C0991_008398, partial [Blastosporella zonata]